MLSRSLKFKMVGFIITALLLTGVSIGVKAQNSSKISVHCSRGSIGVSFESWLPNETLAVMVDGSEVEQYTTSADGSGSYTFPSGATNVALQRTNGDTILAGEADCSNAPLGKIEDVNPYNLTLPVGGSATISVMGKIDNESTDELPVIWTTESGSITSKGEITATEEGEYLVVATYLGKGASYAYQIPLTVTAAIKKLKLDEKDFTLFVGQGRSLDVVALDENDNPVEVSLDWEVGQAGEVMPLNFFIAGETPGDFTITGSVSGTDLSVEIQVHIMPMIERIQIEPDIDSIEVGETQEFHVVAYDADDNEVSLPVSPKWSAEIGGINTQGIYTATTEGEEHVSVIVDLNEMQVQQGGQGVLAESSSPLLDEEAFAVSMRALQSRVDESKSSPQYCMGNLLLPIFFALLLLIFAKPSPSL